MGDDDTQIFKDNNVVSVISAAKAVAVVETGSPGGTPGSAVHVATRNDNLNDNDSDSDFKQPGGGR